MADSYTDNFSFTKPELDASDGTWDEKLNANFDSIDDEVGRASIWLHKDAAYTAQPRERILADTSGAAWTLTLPASPSTGDMVEVQDAAGTWADENLTVDGNGTDIEGAATFLGAASGDRCTLTFNGTQWVRRGSAVVRLPLEFVTKATIDTPVNAVDLELPDDSNHVLIQISGLAANTAVTENIFLRTSADGGITFASGATDYDDADSKISATNISDTDTCTYEIKIVDHNRADVRTSVHSTRFGEGYSLEHGWRSAEDVATHVRIYCGTSRLFTSGTFLMYKYVDLG